MNYALRGAHSICAIAVFLVAMPVESARGQAGASTLVEELRIDGRAADFQRLGVIAVSPSGSTALVDRSDNTIMVFDASGKLLGRFGRRGAGPLEFQLPLQIGWVGDSVWVYDESLRRLTVATRQGKLVRLLPLAAIRWPFGRQAGHVVAPVPRGLFADGAMLVEVVVDISPTDPLTGLPGEPTLGIYLATDSAVPRRLVKEAPPRVGNFRLQHEGAVYGGAIPFIHPTFESIASDGSHIGFLSSEGIRENVAGVSISVFRADGSSAGTFKHDFPAGRVTGAAIDSAVDAYVNRTAGGRAMRPPEIGRLFSTAVKGKSPRSKAAVRAFIVDPSGICWVGLFSSPEVRPNSWKGFDSTGAEIATVVLKSGEQLLAGNREVIWVRGYGVDDFPYVARYRYR